MDQTQQFLKMLITWEFLQEPFWRWVVFIILLGAALTMWNGVLRHMD